ncbi:MAG: hypothetical protein D6728_09760 [Cyanobacteria bacterium J055]|nr:MAG: hypothetical protein D6728_09760 [Cyanobacteria bacterium J055]
MDFIPYSQFTIENIKSDFGITLVETIGFFSQIPDRSYTHFRAETLEKNNLLVLAIYLDSALRVRLR